MTFRTGLGYSGNSFRGISRSTLTPTITTRGMGRIRSSLFWDLWEKKGAEQVKVDRMKLHSNSSAIGPRMQKWFQLAF